MNSRAEVGLPSLLAGVTVLLAWPVVSNERTWSTPLIGIGCWTLCLLSGLHVTRHRPTAVPAPVLPPPFPGAAVTWTGQARLSADMAAPLLVLAVLLGVPSVATCSCSHSTPACSCWASGSCCCWSGPASCGPCW